MKKIVTGFIIGFNLLISLDIECMVATAGPEEKKVRIWDINTGEVTRELEGSHIRVVAFSSDGKKLVSGSSRGMIGIWNPDTGKLINKRILDCRPGITAVACSPDGKKVAFGYTINNNVVIWDLNTDKRRELKVDSDPYTSYTYYSMAFSPDGKRVAAGTFDTTAGKVIVWDLDAGKVVRELTNAKRPMGRRVESVAFSPDGKKVAACAWEDWYVTIWDLETGKISQKFKDYFVKFTSPVVLSSDWKKVAYGGTSRSDRQKHLVKVWNLNAGTLSMETKEGHNGTIYSVAMSPDGTKVVSGSKDKTVKVWDSKTGKLINVLKGHEGPVSSITWRPEPKKRSFLGDKIKKKKKGYHFIDIKIVT